MSKLKEKIAEDQRRYNAERGAVVGRIAEDCAREPKTPMRILVTEAENGFIVEIQSQHGHPNGLLGYTLTFSGMTIKTKDGDPFEFSSGQDEFALMTTDGGTTATLVGVPGVDA